MPTDLSPTPSLTVPLGNSHEPRTVDLTNRSRLWATIATIAQTDGFDFACSLPESDTVSGYHFLYYTTDGTIHLRVISATGRVLRSIDGPHRPTE